MTVTTAKRPGNGKPDPKHNIEAMRQAYYERIAKHHMTPLWKVMSSLITDEPATRCAPAIWHYGDVKSLVMESGGLITRRGGQAPGADPGESGLARRIAGHQHALRRHSDDPARRGRAGAPPRPLGDPLRARRGGRLHGGRGREGPACRPATSSSPPSWAPHDHGNSSKKPMLWLDVLDRADGQFLRDLVRRGFRRAGAGDHAPGRRLAELLRLGRAARRHAGRSTAPRSSTTPMRARGRSSSACCDAGEIDKRHGARVRYANPITGGAVLPTMGAHSGDAAARVSTASPIARPTAPSSSAPKAQGTTEVDGQVLAWGPNDVFVVPPWKRYAHSAAKQSVLFSISDRPAQEALGIWREGK